MLDVFLDALLDSLKVFGLALIFYIILSFVEHKIAHLFAKHQKTTPLIGASCGLIPQCGISVVAADLYQKEHITIGTLMAIFFACSDEALPILMTSEKIIYVIPLLVLKFVFGFILGYLVDFIVKKKTLKKVEQEIRHHEIDSEEENPWHRHLLHPLLHSIKIFLYVFVINYLFGILFLLVGEEQILHFLSSNIYLGPLFAGLVGLIPNCASSVLISELFMIGGLSFGSLMTGLCVNAGLGFIYLLKFKEKRLKVLKIMLVLFLYSLVIGYAILFIMQAFSLN